MEIKDATEHTGGALAFTKFYLFLAKLTGRTWMLQLPTLN